MRTANSFFALSFLGLLLSFSCHTNLYAQSATISNIQLAQRTDGSGLTDIYFDLAGAASSYYISLESSFNGGTSYAPVLYSSISGNTGPMIAGTGKHIVWNGMQSFPNLYSTQAKVKLIVTTTPPPLPCPGVPTVLYSGQTYNTVQIGSQCWLKENLNIGTRINGNVAQTNNGIVEKYCYNDLDSNCAIYGGLYQWSEMMKYISLPGIKGICPTGWHLPTDAEWTTLTTFLGGLNVAGAKMRETDTIHWKSPNTGATNESGFTALPDGVRHYSGYFKWTRVYAFFWSSTETYTGYACNRYIFYNYANVYRNDYEYETNGLSVRCIKN